MKKTKLIITSIIIAIILVITCTATNAFADDNRISIEKDSMHKSGFGVNVLNVTVGTGEDISAFGSDTKSIGINKLFGLGVRDFEYHGEVPFSQKNDYKEYPMYNTHWCSASSRTWTYHPEDTGDLKWESNKTNDLHAQNLAMSGNDFGHSFIKVVAMIPFNLCCFFNSIGAIILNLLIWISNFDIASILKFLQVDKLGEAITKIFVADNGSISPALAIAVMIFIVSLVALAIQRVRKGNVAAQELIKEFFMFILAAILAAICLTGGNISITDSLGKLSNNLLASFGNTSAPTTALFTYKSNNSTADMVNTEQGICSKNYIDTVIKGVFGTQYTIKDLDLYDENDPSVAQNNWGISTDKMKELISNLTEDGADNNPKGDQLFTVHNGESDAYSNKQAPNLGYYFYCGGSNRSYDEPFTTNDNGVEAKAGDPDGALIYISDILASIDAETGGSIKAQSIMRNLNSTNPPLAEMFLTTIVTWATAAAIIIAAGFSLLGKLIFNAGSLLMPILPILILIPQLGLRSKIKKILMTYIMAAVKMIIGQAYIYLIVYSSAILCESGVPGQIIDVALLIGLTIFTPKLFAELNRKLDAPALNTVKNISGGFTRVAEGANSYLNPWKNKERGRNFTNKFKKEKGKANTDDPLCENDEKISGGAANGPSGNAQITPEAQAKINETRQAAQELRNEIIDDHKEQIRKLDDKDKIGYLTEQGRLNKKDAEYYKNFIEKENARKQRQQDGTKLNHAVINFMDSKVGRVATAIPGFGGLITAGATATLKTQEKMSGFKETIDHAIYKHKEKSLFIDEEGMAQHMKVKDQVKDKFKRNKNKKRYTDLQFQDDIGTAEEITAATKEKLNTLNVIEKEEINSLTSLGYQDHLLNLSELNIDDQGATGNPEGGPNGTS